MLPSTEKLKAPTLVSCDLQCSPKAMEDAILSHLNCTLGRRPSNASNHDWWLAACYAVRDRIMVRYISTQNTHVKKDVKRVYYLSLEYLMGRLLHDSLSNSGLLCATEAALQKLGVDINMIAEKEHDMGLGNGGLGRLASCFLDSLATMSIPAIGYGIHYQFGLFRQVFKDGRQIEKPDNWLRSGNPWQFRRPEHLQEVPLFGHVSEHYNDEGDWIHEWVPQRTLVGIPWDIPVLGYGSASVNFLRLWESRAPEDFNLQVFNEGDYVDAVHDSVMGESISKVLYPNDATACGKELRLIQQFFFVCCSIKDIIWRYQELQGHGNDWSKFTEKVAIQLNDTHPTIAIPELMRQLIDEHHFGWDDAWAICQKVFAYTNHTLLPEALEKWSVKLLSRVLPRHIQIIYEINRRFLENEVQAKWPGDGDKKAELSLIQGEGDNKMVRMAYMAVATCHSVNGVAALHTRLLKENLFKSFHELYPDRLNNKTNGVTPRRWLRGCNPGLSTLIDQHIGTEWTVDLKQLRRLEEFADDAQFQKAFMKVKKENKKALAKVIKEECGIEVSADAIFDVQIKRLHEYKRQHLNLLHILTLYRKLLHEPNAKIPPRVFIFGAKAAPGYYLAKEIIYAINRVAQTINNDPRIGDKLKVVFLPNYGVSLAEKIIPAADVSEQISCAGKEASGTGNMKLALNGAVTIGTLDGANVEILEEVGKENIFIFGLSVEDVQRVRTEGYNPWDYYNSNKELQAVLDWLVSDHFTPEAPGALSPLRNSLLDGGDPFMVLADYQAYCDAQAALGNAYQKPSKWAKMAILNTSRNGFFSSDRTIQQYAKEIWKAPSVKIP